MHTKQIIVLRKDLNMRKGKMVAQGAHASMGALLKLMHTRQDDDIISWTLITVDGAPVQDWLSGSFKKICVSVNSEEEMLALQAAAEKARLNTCLITDSGLTEFGGVPTITALAIGPDFEDKINKVCSHLPLL